jgi:hypothetical protein
MQVFKGCGQCSTGPNGVVVQLKERISSPVSPPPERNPYDAPDGPLKVAFKGAFIIVQKINS